MAECSDGSQVHGEWTPKATNQDCSASPQSQLRHVTPARAWATARRLRPLGAQRLACEALAHIISTT